MSVARSALLHGPFASPVPQQKTERLTRLLFQRALKRNVLLKQPTAFQRRLQSTVSDAYQVPPKRSIFARALRTTIGAFTFFSLGIIIGWQTLPSKPQLSALLSKPATDEETLSLYQPPDEASAKINTHILEHPLARSLRANPSFQESRPHMKIPEALRKTNLTGGTLAGPGRIVVPPVQFVEDDGKSLVAIFYLGEQLSGHPGIVHGGLLATLLDEGLARCCFPALPNKIAVTANLKVDYRKPVRAEGYYVLRARTERVEGRKAWVKGWIERLGGGQEEVGDKGAEAAKGAIKEAEKFVEAEALFVEPRNAKLLTRIYQP